MINTFVVVAIVVIVVIVVFVAIIVVVIIVVVVVYLEDLLPINRNQLLTEKRQKMSNSLCY